MEVNESDLIERYSNMSNHELAEIVRSGELTELAKKCLESELKKRDMSNLETEIQELHAADQIHEDQIQEKLNNINQSVYVATKPYYIIGLIFLIIGVVLFVVHGGIGSLLFSAESSLSKKQGVGLGGMLFGTGLITFGFVRAKIKTSVHKLLVR